jgi:hypothetical protein
MPRPILEAAPLAAVSAREAAIDALARALWSLGRTRSLRAVEAMAAAVANRAAARPPADLATIARDPALFPAAAPEHPDHAALRAVGPADPVFALCRRVARRTLAGVTDDRTGGATFFEPGDGPDGLLFVRED